MTPALIRRLADQLGGPLGAGDPEESLRSFGFLPWAGDLTGRLFVAPDGNSLVSREEAEAAIEEYKARRAKAEKKARRR